MPADPAGPGVAAGRALRLVAAILCSGLILAGCRQDPASPPEPRAARIPHAVLSPEGAFSDPYHWLRDDSRRDPEVRAHLDAENRYAGAMLAPLAALRGRLERELEARLQTPDDVAEWAEHGFQYRLFLGPDGSGFRLLRRPADGMHPERVVLDRADLAEADPRLRVIDWDASPDGRRVAWLEQHPAARSFRLRIRDLERGRIHDPAIEGARSLAWSADGRWLYYTLADPATQRSDRVLRIPAEGGTPQPVHHEPDPAFRAAVARTRSGRHVLIDLRATDTREIRRVVSTGDDWGTNPGTNPGTNRGTVRTVALIDREPGHLYSADHVGNSWFVRTNRDAPNFRLVEIVEGNRERWIERVPHSDQAMLLEFDAFDRHIVYAQRVDGQRRIRVLDRRDGTQRTIDFGPEPQVLRLGRNPEPAADHLRFVHSAPAVPRAAWTYAFDTGALVREPHGRVSGPDPAAYRVERLWIEARDGARVPVTFVARNDTPLDGRAPLLIEGYGAYGRSLEPAFDADRLSLLDRGFVIALAHVRGGQERGRRWYLEGRGTSKINSFHDFIDVTDHLAGSGRIDADRIYAVGGSAGGLLVAAAANIAPQHYDGIVARVPFVDVVQTMLDPAIPLTAQEYLEWGDPRRPDEFEAMRRWSPYDNVRRQDYPAMLVTAGLWDAQVPYWAPVKWVARLRALRTNDAPLLLLTDLDGGHDLSDRQARVRQRAAEYAFLLDLAGCRDGDSCVGSG